MYCCLVSKVVTCSLCSLRVRANQVKGIFGMKNFSSDWKYLSLKHSSTEERVMVSDNCKMETIVIEII